MVCAALNVAAAKNKYRTIVSAGYADVLAVGCVVCEDESGELAQELAWHSWCAGKK